MNKFPLWTFLFFCSVLMFYPADSTSKVFIQSTDVRLGNGEILEQKAVRDAKHLITAVPITADAPFFYKLDMSGVEQAIIKFYVTRGSTGNLAQEYQVYKSKLCHAYLTDANNYGGTNTPALNFFQSAVPDIYTVQLSYCSGEVLIIDKQIIR